MFIVTMVRFRGEVKNSHYQLQAISLIRIMYSLIIFVNESFYSVFKLFQSLVSHTLWQVGSAFVSSFLSSYGVTGVHFRVVL